MIHSKRFSAALLTGLLGVAMPFASTQAATYTQQEQANIKVVADFYAALDRGDASGDLKKKIRVIAEQYLAHPSAAPLGQLAHARALREEWVNPWEIQPLYLRAPDAKINWSTRASASRGGR